MSAVTVKDLTFSYEDDRRILNGLSFSIEPGEIFVIAGLSGCGKTTLCHILNGIIPNSVKGKLGGSVEIFDKPVGTLSETARRVGLVFQNSDEQIISTTVEDELAFGPENLCMEPDEIRGRVDGMAERLGLAGMMEKDPSLLSGGQKKLLCIGSVLILEPDILILDEPLGNLDEAGRRLVHDTILSLRAEGRTVIMVEHDLSLAEFADRWMLLKDGKIAGIGSPASFLEDKTLLTELEMWFD